jgi:hypothetical protein
VSYLQVGIVSVCTWQTLHGDLAASFRGMYAPREKESAMAFVTGEVVPSPGGELPFKVVFKQGDTVLSEMPVASEEEGEREIVTILRGLQARIREERDSREDPDSD